MFNSPSNIIGIAEIIVMFLVGLMGGASGMLISRSEQKISTAKDRLDQVYSPLFNLIEPNLYAKMSLESCDEIIQNICKVVHDIGPLVDPKLRLLLSRYKQASKRPIKSSVRSSNYSAYWFEICEHIDFTYDDLCLTCHLPIRSTEYREHFGQKLTKRQRTRRQILITVRKIRIFLKMFLMALLMYALLKTAVPTA